MEDGQKNLEKIWVNTKTAIPRYNSMFFMYLKWPWHGHGMAMAWLFCFFAKMP